MNIERYIAVISIEGNLLLDDTLKARSKNETVSEDMYLIEDVGIDKILTWQNTKGELFQTVGKGIPEKLGIGLCEYVEC